MAIIEFVTRLEEYQKAKSDRESYERANDNRSTPEFYEKLRAEHQAAERLQHTFTMSILFEIMKTIK